MVMLLQSHLRRDFEQYIEQTQKEHSKMLTNASATPRPESGPTKLKLQAEALEKLTEFDDLLSELQSGGHENFESEGPWGMDIDETSDKDSNIGTDNDGMAVLEEASAEVLDEFGLQTFSDEEELGDD
jgi:hypothetical protein